MDIDRICLIATEWEYGAGTQGTNNGPTTLIEVCKKEGFGLLSECPMIMVHSEVSSNELTHSKHNYLNHAAPLITHQKRHADQVLQVLKKDNFPLILSGDHSNAIGGMAGFFQYFGTEKSGLIWIDAHLDLHSPFTTPSGNIHGMALNTAFGIDNLENQVNTLDQPTVDLWQQIKSLKKTNNLSPENVVFFGIRSFESPEIEMTKNHGMLVITAKEIHENGMEWAINKAESHLANKVEQLYISFDVDSLDPSISTGTGTPVEDGFTHEEASKLLTHYCNHPLNKCMEITEINPSLESDNAMSKAVCKILKSAIKQPIL
jgi:arginase